MPGTFYCDHRNLQSLLNKSQREDSVSEPLEKGDCASRVLACSQVAKKSQLGDFPLQLRSQWRGLGAIPGKGTTPHVPQLKIPNSVAKTWCSKINTFFFFFKEKPSWGWNPA